MSTSRSVALLSSAAIVFSSLVAVAPAASADDKPGSAPEVTSAVAHDTSPPLRELAKMSENLPSLVEPSPRAVLNRPIPQDRIDAVINGSGWVPPVISDPTGPEPNTEMPAISGSFEGLNNIAGYNPPDTVGDVGTNHYMQMTNVKFQIWNKSGTSVFGPADNNTLWAGFGECGTTNDGDPIVMHDQFADRWLASQFSVSGTGFHECVAVSTTADPTGTWYRYQFDYTGFPDYPKFGVWPDGYYVTYNMFNAAGTAFLGAKTCAMNRAAMLTGAAVTQQCFDRAEEWSLLPSDADGSTPPPLGSPNYILGEHWSDNTKLTMYKFHVDWATPANSTFTGPISLSVAPYIGACWLGVDRGRCVPQPGTSQRLEALGGKTMYRLAYRNFGDHESLVTNHTVAMDGQTGLTAQTGVGWYEIRQPNAATPQVYQDGVTADPNGSTFRWMGSIAMDKQGNMALGYSTSNATPGANSFPSIRYIGRKIWDPLNQMAQAESVIMAGSGVQTGGSTQYSGRWGDYSSMNVDPTDDCTFWYTNEYVQTTGAGNWRTRIAKFKFPGCNGTPPTASSSIDGLPGNSSVDVAFSAAATAADLPVTKYTVTAAPGGASCTTTPGVTPDPLTCKVTGLTNGQPYTFTVKARNDAGDGANSAASAPVTPFTVPGAPFAPSAVPGNQDASVSWSPADNGGSMITKYTATAAPGGASCTTSGTTCTVPGLINGTAYTFNVVATNVAGDGPPSTTAAVTPTSQAQTAKVKTPKKIKPKGKTVLLKKAVTTNAGQKAKAKVKVSPKSKKYSKVKITKSGKVTIQTKGKKKLKVTLKLTAPATDRYTAYSYTKKWKVKK
ncbi:MAG: fibronectin type III domain-containing protein [Candidatus Nanopelagicales bacterium]|nr:fibronectin type III domain-containing protein [Candidatus Nanopelagicales bacterium]